MEFPAIIIRINLLNVSLGAMKYAYVAPKSSLSPIFGTSNPGLNSSIGRLTIFIGPGEAGPGPGHSEPLSS